MADGPSLLDRAVARWEVSRLTSLPLTLSFLTLMPLPATTRSLALFGHSSSSRALAVVLPIGWLMVAALDGARGLWVSRHPFASARWLRAVRAVVGDDVARRGVAWLVRRYGDEPDYRVRRSDMALAIRIGRAERREAACRAEGLRLRPAAPDADPPAAPMRRHAARVRA